ncbi:MAG: DUF3313 family protein [Halieaceae bacterium]|nr:DUF3313 family protein [Halieaceae bacterium]
MPRETHDGLTLVPGTKFDTVYLKTGADLSDYPDLGLEACNVAFKKNWMRDQNSNRMDLSNRVTQQDVDKIKDRLGELCDEQFREALLDGPAYNLVDNFANGEHVLILRPSIINLIVNAPDVRSAGMSRDYTTSAGEMTLSMDLVDATTGETLARIVDRRRDYDNTRMQWSNSVTNRSVAIRIIKRWTRTLRDGLDEIHES